MDPTGEEIRRRAQRTRERLGRIDGIPTLPAVLVEVWSLTSRQDTSARDLARAMSSDPGLTGAVLRLANSAYFGFPRKVSTVTQAVVILGFETVKGLAMGASVFRALDPGRGAGLDPDAFFRHSLATAMGARLAVEHRAPQRSGTAFASGILHDVGKLIVAAFLSGPWRRLGEHLGAGVAYEEAEREATGMTHAEIGGWFADRWAFPAELGAAVRWHHRPQEAPGHREYAAAVHLGDAIAHRVGAGGSGRPDAPELLPEAAEALGLDGDATDVIAERVSDALSAAPAAGSALGA